MCITFEQSLLIGEKLKKDRPFRTDRQPKPGKGCRVRLYRGRWYGLPPPFRKQLWEAYGQDRERYYLSYQPNDEDFKYLQEEGMAALVRMERRLLRQDRLAPYFGAGTKILHSFGAVLSDETPAEQSNVVFVAIDFEGSLEKTGVHEMGVAIISSRQLLAGGDEGIACSNYAWKYMTKRKVLVRRDYTAFIWIRSEHRHHSLRPAQTGKFRLHDCSCRPQHSTRRHQQHRWARFSARDSARRRNHRHSRAGSYNLWILRELGTTSGAHASVESLTEESDSRTAAFSKKRKQPASSLQHEHKDTEISDKRVKLDRLRNKYNTLEPGEISDATSFSRRSSKDCAANTGSYGFPNTESNFNVTTQSGWTPINGASGYDPFVNPQHNALHPKVTESFVTRAAAQNDQSNEDVVLEKIQNGKLISDDEYLYMARWLLRNDADLRLQHITHPGLAIKVKHLLNTHNLTEQYGLAYTLQMLCQGYLRYYPAQTFLADRYRAVRTSSGRIGNASSATLTDAANVEMDGGSTGGSIFTESDLLGQLIIRRLRNLRDIELYDRYQVAQWLRDNDITLRLQYIEHKGLRERVRALLKVGKYDEQQGVAKILGMLSQSNDHSSIAREFLEKRYEEIRALAGKNSNAETSIYTEENFGNLSRSAMVGHPGGLGSYPSATAEASIDEMIRMKLETGIHLPRHDYQHIVDGLHDNHTGPKLIDVANTKLQDRVRAMMGDEAVASDSSIAELLGRLALSRKDKSCSAEARTFLAEYYKIACNIEAALRVTGVVAKVQRPLDEKELTVAEEQKAANVGLLRLVDIKKRRVHRHVAERVKASPYKSVEECLREAVVHQGNFHQKAEHLLRTTYESHGISGACWAREYSKASTGTSG